MVTVQNVYCMDIHGWDRPASRAYVESVVLGKQVGATSSGPRGAQSSPDNASVDMGSVRR